MKGSANPRGLFLLNRLFIPHLVPGVPDAGLLHGQDLVDVVLGEHVVVGVHLLLALRHRLVGVLRRQPIRQLRKQDSMR